MSDKVHPFRRRKHRRGKRGGKRHQESQRAKLTLVKVAPESPSQAVVLSLRSRLAIMNNRLRVSNG